MQLIGITKENLQVTFYRLLTWASKENLNNTFWKLMSLVFVSKISSKSVDAETNIRHRKMNKNVDLLRLYHYTAGNRRKLQFSSF